MGYFTAKMVDGQLVTTHHLGELEGAVIPAGETVVDLPEGPEFTLFADARKLEAGKVVIDMAKAREIHKRHLVGLVDARLNDIDVRAVRAMREAFLTGDNSRVTQLENDATALRAVRTNPGLDSISDAQTLAAYLPAILQ